MTTKEFNDTFFSKRDSVIYKGQKYAIVSIDFDNHLLGIAKDCNSEPIQFVHCEEVTYVPNISSSNK